jgi:hypothetical protein
MKNASILMLAMLASWISTLRAHLAFGEWASVKFKPCYFFPRIEKENYNWFTWNFVVKDALFDYFTVNNLRLYTMCFWQFYVIGSLHQNLSANLHCHFKLFFIEIEVHYIVSLNVLLDWQRWSCTQTCHWIQERSVLLR